MPDSLNASDLSGGFDLTTLFLGGFFAMIGVGFFIYGKKQSEFWFMICGIALNVYPFFVSGVPLIFLAGAALCAAPFLIKRYCGE